MRKNATKLAALALTLAMTVTSVALPSSASAATKTVKLNTTSKTLYATGSSAKKTTTLKVTVNGKKKTATFKSSNKKVATVGKTSGKVTAKKAGKATITATYGGKKVKCKITVKAKFVKVTSVSVSPKTVSLAVGKTKTIKTTVKPSNASIKKVTYASDKKSVATVSSTGKITAKKAGTAKVTVTATDGTKKKATVTVKVTKAPTPTATPDATTTPTPTETPAATATSASATAITSFKQTGAAKLTAEFSGAVSNAAKVEVTKDGKNVDGTATFAADKKSVVFESKGNFVAGEYVITVTDGDKKLTEKTAVEAAKLDKIEIKDSEALTGVYHKTMAGTTPKGKENTAVYIYYDALNQFGESMRESADISWTISSMTEKEIDKTTGRITIANKENSDYKTYTYGTDIYIVGVNAKSGVSVSKSVKVGMAQAIHTVDFKGFIDTKGDKTKFLQDLPKNFEAGRYELCYAALDQNGNTMEAVEYSKDNLTLLADNPLVVKSEFTPGKIHTVAGVSYASVKVNPGDRVDDGASVTFTMISNKTGKKTERIFQVGAAAKLKSLTIQAPTSTVADGDKDVTLNYVAIDTDGNQTTSYETIVRSTNALTLSANPGTLKISEDNSGAAVIKWSDETKYSDLKATTNPYSHSDTWDGQPRVVAISTIVAGVGGESKNMTFEVSDIRRPTTISHVKLNGDDNDAIVSGATAKIDFIGTDDVTYIDQYNQKLDKDKVEAFFKASKENSDGIDGKRYAIEAKTASSVGATGDTSKLWENHTKEYYEYGADTIEYKANLGDADDVVTYNEKTNDYTNAVKAYDLLDKTVKKLESLEKEQTALNEDSAAIKTFATKYSSLDASVSDLAGNKAAIAKINAVLEAAKNAKTEIDNFAGNLKGSAFEDQATGLVTAQLNTKITDSALESAKIAELETATDNTKYANIKTALDNVKSELDTVAGKIDVKVGGNGNTITQEKTAKTGERDTAKGARDTAKTAMDAAKKNATFDRTNVVIKYAIVSKAGSSDYSAESKTNSVEYTVLPQLEVRDRLDITFNATKLKSEADSKLTDDYATDGLVAISDANKVDDKISNVSNFNNKAIGEFTVKGTTSDGKVVTIPKEAYTADVSNSQLVNNENVITKINADASKPLYIKDFYDFNVAKNVRKDATAKLAVKVYGTIVSKSIAVAAAKSAPKEVKFTYKKKFATDGVVNPSKTKIVTLDKTLKLDETDDLRYVVLDQYDCPINDAAVSKTISEIKESDTAFNHLVKSFAPVQNGTADASVDKAEIGDNYKLTVSVDGTTVSGSVNVTVGSDSEAYITDDAAKQDETFRKEFLEMTR